MIPWSKYLVKVNKTELFRYKEVQILIWSAHRKELVKKCAVKSLITSLWAVVDISETIKFSAVLFNQQPPIRNWILVNLLTTLYSTMCIIHRKKFLAVEHKLIVKDSFVVAQINRSNQKNKTKWRGIKIWSQWRHNRCKFLKQTWNKLDCRILLLAICTACHWWFFEFSSC